MYTFNYNYAVISSEKRYSIINPLKNKICGKNDTLIQNFFEADKIVGLIFHQVSNPPPDFSNFVFTKLCNVSFLDFNCGVNYFWLCKFIYIMKLNNNCPLSVKFLTPFLTSTPIENEKDEEIFNLGEYKICKKIRKVTIFRDFGEITEIEKSNIQINVKKIITDFAKLFQDKDFQLEWDIDYPFDNLGKEFKDLIADSFTHYGRIKGRINFIPTPIHNNNNADDGYSSPIKDSKNEIIKERRVSFSNPHLKSKFEIDQENSEYSDISDDDSMIEIPADETCVDLTKLDSHTKCVKMGDTMNGKRKSTGNSEVQFTSPSKRQKFNKKSPQIVNTNPMMKPYPAHQPNSSEK